jgi:hypothetical protein
VKRFEITLLNILAISLIAISCKQKKEQDNSYQELTPVITDSYYYINYHCFDFVKQCELEILKLVKLDTLIYVKSSQFHGQYEEIHGKLTQINDSIYHVEPFRHFVQSGNGDKPLYMYEDSIVFFCDSIFIGSNLKIEYLNGRTKEHIIQSTENILPINLEFFNDDNERIYLSFSYKNPIVNENVELVSKFSDIKYSIGFSSMKNSDSFYIIVNDDKIKTLNNGTRGHQSLGPKFELDKMPINTQLPRNRKLYN